MAGQLTIDTLRASSGVLATQNGMTGIAKAWLTYNGNAQTISSSFNVSSVTRNATGDYTINFTTALTDANYSPAFSTVGASTTNISQTVVIKGSTSSGATVKSTTQLGIQVGSSSSGAISDSVLLTAVVFGS